MRQQQARTVLAAALLALAGPAALAQTAPQQPSNEQVIQPEVERRELRLPKFPSKDFEIGLYGGLYATENFGSSAVGGLRLGYHITEDFFVQGTYGRTKISDEAFRNIFPDSGPLPSRNEPLAYYNLSAGWNVLPGEVFVGRNRAFASQVYLMAGVGSTKFNTGRGDLKRQTINVGLGMRVMFHDRFGVQVDLRDHILKLDILGDDARRNHLELTTGVSYFF